MPQSAPLSGTYTISASGYGYLDNPVSSGDRVYGLVSNGVFIGSSTENTNGFNDFFIAAPQPSSSVASTAFRGSYSIAYFVPGSSPVNSADALFQLNPDGQGNLGTVNPTGYTGGGGLSTVTQTSSNVRYAISNAAANIMFPNSSSATLISGNEYLYLTPDGNFVFGGSPTGFDIFIGVRQASSGKPNLKGLYYSGGIDQDDSQLANGTGALDTYYGSFDANAGVVVGHQRVLSALSSSVSDYTYNDGYSVNSDGSYDDTATATHYVVGDGGAVRIGFGIGPFLGISIAVQAPRLSRSGVFLSPEGVVNAASSAPFTAGIAPGELITLYGTNLAPSVEVASTVPFPTKLNGVQVPIDQIPAPIYVVSPGQISAIVPYSASFTVAEIQVINNGASSNVVTEFMNKTAPGVFTLPPGGLGDGAVLHSNYSVVTASRPAQVGETVSVYLTGLGAVFRPIQDGAAAPAKPLSLASNTIAAYIGGLAATVTYGGLAPELAGLYQVNLQVPSGVSAGETGLLYIRGRDSGWIGYGYHVSAAELGE